MVALWNGFMICNWIGGKDAETETGLIHYLFRLFENKELLITMNFSFALQYAIWKVQLNQEGMRMSGTNQHLFERNTQVFY